MNANTSILPRRQQGGHWNWRVQQLLLERLAKLEHGVLQVSFDNGGRHVLEGDHPGPGSELQVHRPVALARALALRGDLGFAEAYMRGDWSSRDLPGLLYLFSVNLEAYERDQRRSLPVRLMTRLQHLLRRNSRRGSRRNIAAHYDLGNDFYARWLDGSMSYSSAVYDRSFDLARAQERKYELILAQLDPEPGEHILEIGCGWGGFAEYAARQGMLVTAVTLSQEQYDYAARRIRAAGLQDQVELRLADYRTLQGQFDHIVSIEMFEAVGQEYWATYHEVLNRCLKPGGRVALQVITIRKDLFETYRRESGGFIQRYIFPGGMLPTENHLCELARESGLEPLAMERYGEHYADTLADWGEAFNAQTPWLEEHGYDVRFRRMWRYYLAFCEAGFRDGRIDLVHLCLHKD
jgi:cyclopropane-fatty-acyl-phospholipid synthase